MYGDYNESRYMDNYGRRGVPGSGRSRGRYRAGHSGADHPLNEMHEHYNNYLESRDAAEDGHYGAEKESMKALEYMLESVCEFMEMLIREAGSQEEAQLIKKHTRKIGEM